MSWYWSAFGLVAAVGSAGGTLHLLLNYRQSSAAIGWVFTLWVLPFAGLLIYLAFGVYQGPRKIRERRDRSQRLRQAERRSAYFIDRDEREPATRRDRIASVVSPFPLLGGNRVTLHRTVAEAEEDLFRLVRSAEREIMVLTYTWGNDSLTQAFADALEERLQAGVHVKVVVDAIGSIAHKGSAVDRMLALGAEAAEFLEPSPFKGRFQVNFRNHRKMLVVDGVSAVVGGRNLVAEYFDESPEGIRDLSVRIEGPAVAAIRGLFIEDWLVATDNEASLPLECDVPGPVGGSWVRVLPLGPDERGEGYLAVLGAAFAEAQRDILIVSPYFVPGAVMMHQLTLAALRGVRVRLLLPEKSPERWPDLAARRFFGPLLEAGVEIWLRRPPFLHAKAILVDGEWSVFGSANFDQRSFHLNYEVCFEVPEVELAARLEEYFASDFEAATRVDPDRYRSRPWYRRALENAAALMEPLL